MTILHPFPIPMTIISGFLGAGKTTVLNHILHSNHGLKIAVLVNDFGAINIDTQLVVGIEGEMVNLANGCICCTIRGDLLQAVVNLVRRDDPPQYIIIETSGVSDPIAVANTFFMPEVKPVIRVDSILVVVDSEQLLNLTEDNYDVAIDQIDVADIIVLNKIDMATPEQLDKTRHIIRQIAPDARILEVSHGKIPVELVIGVGNFAPEKLVKRAEKDIHIHGVDEDHDHHNHDDHEHVAHHHHDDHTKVFSTWSWMTDKPLILSKVRDMFEKLPNTIYRAKGVIHLADVPHRMVVLQLVGRRANLTLAGEWGDDTPRTQIVMIGSHGGIDNALLQAQLEACVLEGSLADANIPDRTEWMRY
ncbi:MAG: cobalamin biosynthesis protein P47K [Phototrophicales bacterium]|nr:MAG: cobalamin biosynthesis protein P47K [Phototrophicales bacterium]